MKEKSTVPRVQTPRVKKPNVTHTKPTAGSVTRNPQRSPATHNANETAIPFAKGQISFVLPTKVLSNPELIGDYKDVLTAINTFVSKCEPFLKEDSQPNDSE